MEKAVAEVKVSSIFIYPVKSCRGISVSQAPVTPTGFRWDRQWLVVNYKGRAYTQRVEPKLALVEVQLPNEAFVENWEPAESSYLVLKAPGMDVLKVSLSTPKEIADGVSVWEWSGAALDEGADASKWFSDYLGKPCRLVRFNAASETRPVEPEYAPGHQTMFSDMYPYMLLSQESLDALNELLKEPIPINRFRPNILVNGCEPFSEDLWTEIRIDKLTFQGVKLCSRCKVPTIDQKTGIAGPEPNDTLKKIRSDAVLRPTKKQQGRVYFGQNLVCRDSLTGGGGKGHVIKVGDLVYVLKMVSSAEEAAA
ncbi:PREDICTED: mitochondrial amidoxime reducing component 2-like [Fragaria vesca subsp. vesca]|uniref:mitochondrial amidoxime reducing component 2-like n=1 Tax=Fragaria vesca subsp. vesca TaxID=101020 RepID=UPI0002C3469F|nr:PREDICTED: mitochondrial amidoxime reducing component 2-like [Fragaria vesca subsp. vesca]